MSFFRDAFLALSTNPAAHKAVIGFPPSRKMTRRFVAGETLDEAIETVRRVNDAGMRGVFDFLGEAVTNVADSHHARDEYLRILDAIETHKLNAYASLKPTQMGLAISHHAALENISIIARRARQVGTSVRVEMEDSSFTQATLDLVRELRVEYPNVGTVIQSCLYRSEQDMRDLLAQGVNVRLVKGAYKEPPTVAFPAKKDVDANYIKLAEMYLGEGATSPQPSPAAKERATPPQPSPAAEERATPPQPSPYQGEGVGGVAFLALATHDSKIIGHAKEFINSHNVPHTRFEFQMLYGIRTELQKQLHAEGYPVRVYVPYGSMWYPYFMRRLAERPANVFFLLNNLFK